MHFLLYLVNSGAIESAAAMELLGMHLRSRVPLARIALRERMLTVKQVMCVLDLQASLEDAPRFSDLSVRLGILSDEQVSHLRRLQREEALGIDQLLLGHGLIHPAELALARQRYDASLDGIEGARLAA